MKRAPAHESGPWVTDRVMMCRKTAIKRVAKYVRLTPGQRAMLDEDAAREQDDIAPERHRQNVVDLFGEGVNPTAPEALRAAPASYAVDPETGELLAEDERSPLRQEGDEAARIEGLFEN